MYQTLIALVTSLTCTMSATAGMVVLDVANVTGLSNVSAAGINNVRQAVGWYSCNDGTEVLNFDVNGSVSSRAFDINDNGQFDRLIRKNTVAGRF